MKTKKKEARNPSVAGTAKETEIKQEIKSKQNMKKGKVIFFGVIIVIIVVLAVWAGILIATTQSGSNPDAPSPYSAVYLSTGDIYFGKLSWFPSPHMTDVWFISRSQGQNGQVQTALAPWKSVFWGPTDEISFNAQDIVFSTRLMNGSQVVTAMENPTPTGQQNGIGVNPSGVPSGAGTSATSTK